MTGGKISVRKAGEEDIPSLYGMIGILGFHKDEGYFERCLGERDVFIAALGGRDCGYATLNRNPHYHMFRRLGIPELQDMNVIPEARRHGVATALIRHCEETARSEGHAQLGIGVGLYSGYGNAQRLYVKLGYVPDGSGVAYDGQTVAPGEFRRVDDDLCLMMVKDLSR